jgi:hypothetical protein
VEVENLFDMDGGKIVEGSVFGSELESSKDGDWRLWLYDRNFFGYVIEDFLGCLRYCVCFRGKE